MDGLGKRIKEAADFVGGLDAIASRLTDVSRRTLSDWANDKTEPRASSILEICNITDVSPMWLMTGEGEMNDPRTHDFGRGNRNPSDLDVKRLAHSIEIIERGLFEGQRTPTPSAKAEMILAAYEMLDAPSPAVENRILRLVIG